jgi:hypothetical protein
MKKTSLKKQERKKAKKLLKFWFKMMLETDLMNETEHRKEMMFVIRTL